ncbi:hypothetical protein BGZ57DRAFT_923210 [Hyaloscypha finlandica]|nr:hypothetical protein BGZ57DRAFT_923210 [Hyaloscypha finlandica]
MESNDSKSTVPTEETKRIEGFSIAELQAELSRRRQIENAPLSQLESLKPAEEKEKCYFLRTIPLEVRNQIYGYLLTSDILASSNSIYQLPLSYGLYPNILYTGRQVYEEASAVLYGGKNTFIIDCQIERKAASPLFRSSSATNINNYTWYIRLRYQDLPLLAAIKKVKSWKLIIGTAQEMSELPSTTSFIYFCRAICDARPASLLIEIIPKGLQFSYNYLEDSSLKGYYHPVQKVLEPLKMLRNVAKLEFGVVKGDELPLYEGATTPNAPSIDHNYLCPHLEAKFKSLVEGDSKVVHLWKLYDNLLAYAQAFERSPVFQDAMKSEYGEARRRLNPSHSLARDPDREYPWKKKGLFKYGQVFHTVEDMLEHASFASETGDKKNFKAARQAVLEYLEPQYLRMLAASAAVAEFIKAEKRHGGLFQADLQAADCALHRSEEFGEAFILLQDYNESLKRDLTRETRIEIAIRHLEWEQAYAADDRKFILERLGGLVESRRSVDNLLFIRYFKHCVDYFDLQYLSVREARKAVFADDPVGKILPLGKCFDDWAQPWRCDQHVNWTVNEPDLGPWGNPNRDAMSEASYESDWTSDSIDFSDEDMSDNSDSDDEFGDE